MFNCFRNSYNLLLNRYNHKTILNNIQYSIALKRPNSKTYCSIDNDDTNSNFIIEEDINIWINSKINKNKWKNQLLYNDELPNTICENEHIEPSKNNYFNKKGHCKGIILWNSERLGWLIHSVPKYPNIIRLNSENKIDEIDNNQLIYGQSFIYIEMNIQNLDNILKQIYLMESNIYYTTINNIFNDMHQKIDNNAIRCTINQMKITDNIYHISKNSKWNFDLYDNYLVDFCKSNILCQTWMKPGLNSTNNTKNIKTIRWNKDITYITSQDHSKYAISMNKKNPWIFVGDINRMESQYKRGGGGLVIRDEKIWKAFNKIIIDYNELVKNPNL